jgi:hypothetical protein
MTALLDVERRAAETKNQKLTEALFGTREVTAGVHRSKDLIVRHLPVESGDKAPEAVFTNGRIDILFFQRADRNIRSEWRRSKRAKLQRNDIVCL